VVVKGCGINPDLKAINQEGCFTIFQKKFVDNIGIVGGVLGFFILSRIDLHKRFVFTVEVKSP
jgi:hypothetical protein